MITKSLFINLPNVN